MICIPFLLLFGWEINNFEHRILSVDRRFSVVSVLDLLLPLLLDPLLVDPLLLDPLLLDPLPLLLVF